MMSQNGIATKKKSNTFTRRIPENPRYKNVKTKLDTGASVHNYNRKKEAMRKDYKIKQGEKFKRMKASMFAELIIQVAEVVNQELERQMLESRSSEMTSSRMADDVNSDEEEVDTERSTLHNVLRGVGEIDLHEKNTNAVLEALAGSTGEDDQHGANNPRGGGGEGDTDPRAPDPACLPFLLLDVRQPEFYEQCHVIGAINYPSTMLTRSINYLIKDLLLFKNKPGKIVIVYDDDETLAPRVATVLFEREMENVVLLSGGMKMLHRRFPGCFMTGTLPTTCHSPVTDRKGRVKPTPVVTDNIDVIWYDATLIEKIADFLEIESEKETSRTTSRQTSKPTSRASARERIGLPPSTAKSSK